MPRSHQKTPMNTELDLAVVIVSWNTRELTLDTLRTLYVDLDSHGPNSEVWVFDGGSTDGSVTAIQEYYPRVRLIANEQNLGFAGGNNFVLRKIGFDLSGPTHGKADLPRAVYLLNPDTRTQLGATRTLFNALFDLPHAGVVGARLNYEDGSFQHSAFRFPGLSQLVIDLFPVPGRLYESRLNGRYPRVLYDDITPFSVDHTLGATMMLRREVILETGGFDEEYFMYVEEVDWSQRIRQAGWEIYCVPTARVTHLGGQSTKQVRPRSTVNLWKSRLRYVDKTYTPAKRHVARAIVKLGMRRQIAKARHDYARGILSVQEQDALIDAYRTILRL